MIEEVAVYTKLSRSKIYEMAPEGMMPCAKLAGQWRFSRTNIDASARQQRPPAVGVDKRGEGGEE